MSQHLDRTLPPRRRRARRSSSSARSTRSRSPGATLVATALGWALAGRELASAAAAFEARERFAANAGHELRSPLTVIRTEVDVALADPDAGVARAARDGRGRDRDGRPHGRAARRADAARARGPPAAAARAGRPRGGGGHRGAARTDARTVALQLDLRPATVRGERQLLERLAENLVENGVRYNAPGGFVAVHTGARDGEALLRVVNSGPHVPADDRRAAARAVRARRPRAATTAARGSASRSCARSPRRTAAASRSRRGPRAGSRSTSCSRGDSAAALKRVSGGVDTAQESCVSSRPASGRQRRRGNPRPASRSYAYAGEITPDGQYIDHDVLADVRSACSAAPIARGHAPGEFWESRVAPGGSRRLGSASTEQLLDGEDAEVKYRLHGLDGVTRDALGPRPPARQPGGRDARAGHHLGRHRCAPRPTPAPTEASERFSRLLDVVGEHVYLALAFPDGPLQGAVPGPGRGPPAGRRGARRRDGELGRRRPPAGPRSPTRRSTARSRAGEDARRRVPPDRRGRDHPLGPRPRRRRAGAPTAASRSAASSPT